MRTLVAVFALIIFLASSSLVMSASPREYQVTGPLLEVKDDYVTVQKGNEKWQIARDKDTKVSGGELKEGEKVTIHYTMKAQKIDVKGEEGKSETPAKKKK